MTPEERAAREETMFFLRDEATEHASRAAALEALHLVGRGEVGVAVCGESAAVLWLAGSRPPALAAMPCLAKRFRPPVPDRDAPAGAFRAWSAAYAVTAWGGACSSDEARGVDAFLCDKRWPFEARVDRALPKRIVRVEEVVRDVVLMLRHERHFVDDVAGDIWDRYEGGVAVEPDHLRLGVYKRPQGRRR